MIEQQTNEPTFLEWLPQVTTALCAIRDKRFLGKELSNEEINWLLWAHRAFELWDDGIYEDEFRDYFVDTKRVKRKNKPRKPKTPGGGDTKKPIRKHNK